MNRFGINFWGYLSLLHSQRWLAAVDKIFEIWDWSGQETETLNQYGEFPNGQACHELSEPTIYSTLCG